MIKIVTTSTTGLGIALATAAPAVADESGFINAINAVGHYSTVYPSETVQVGYRVCDAFQRGGKSAAIQQVLTEYNRDDSANREYYATLFAQSAATELCPQHAGEIGQI